MNLPLSHGLIYVKPTKGEAPIVIVLSSSIARADIPELCERARKRFEHCEGRVVICDAGAVTDPDAVAVDAVARLQLTAKRVGCELRLRHACAELEELIALAGLSEVVPRVPG